MDFLLAVIVLWLWACTAILAIWMDEEVDKHTFNFRNWDDWVGAILAPIHVTWAVGTGIWQGLFGSRQN